MFAARRCLPAASFVARGPAGGSRLLWARPASVVGPFPVEIRSERAVWSKSSTASAGVTPAVVAGMSIVQLSRLAFARRSLVCSGAQGVAGGILRQRAKLAERHAANAPCGSRLAFGSAASTSRSLRVVALDAGTVALPDADWHRVFGEIAGTNLQIELHGKTDGQDVGLVVDRALGADVLLTNKVALGAKALQQLRADGRLGLVCSIATGFNHIDVSGARDAGIDVCNVPAYASSSTAQHALALLLALCNRVEAHNGSVQAGGWERSPHFWYQESEMIEIRGRTVGLVGLGGIGGLFAELLRPFAPKRILAFTPSKKHLAGQIGPSGVVWASSVEEIFEGSDMISLHCPLTKDNAGFVNTELLRKMRAGALLVNASRGGLIDEAALAAALKSGHCGGAAVDVLVTEPPVAGSPSPLMGLPNCLITPHYGWSSLESRQRLLEITAQNIASWASGAPSNLVN